MSETMNQQQVRDLMSGKHVPKQKPRMRPAPRDLTLTLPHPANACNPNARVHWTVKAKAVKKLREAAKIMADYELSKLNAAPPMWEEATVQATFYRPGKQAKMLDEDNAIGMCKAACDGLQEIGIIVNDSGLHHLPPKQVIGDAADERKLVLVLREV